MLMNTATMAPSIWKGFDAAAAIARVVSDGTAPDPMRIWAAPLLVREPLVKTLDAPRVADRVTCSKTLGDRAFSGGTAASVPSTSSDTASLAPASLPTSTPVATAAGPKPGTKVAEVSWLRPDVIPKDVGRLLGRSKLALKNLKAMSPSQRKHFVHYIDSAKRAETRSKRAGQAIELLEQKITLDMYYRQRLDALRKKRDSL